MPRPLDRYRQSTDGPTFRVLGRGHRWLVWHEGAERLDGTFATWDEMHEYTEERLAIEGGMVLVAGHPTYAPGDDRSKPPPRE